MTSIKISKQGQYYLSKDNTRLCEDCSFIEKINDILYALKIQEKAGASWQFYNCDTNQIDLKQKKDSGLPYLFNMKGKIEGLGVYELKTNHRHPIVDDILQYFEDNKTEK